MVLMILRALLQAPVVVLEGEARVAYKGNSQTPRLFDECALLVCLHLPSLGIFICKLVSSYFQ